MTASFDQHLGDRRRAGRADRIATMAFGVLLVAALPLLLYWGRDQWFFLDEWSFLAARPLPSLDGFFENHNGHWVTIPLVLFRVNFELFGLTTYVPYQTLVVISHLTIAVLGQCLMRRMGVRPWIAALTGVGFVFLGAGVGNLIFAFQITLNGSVIAGLGQLLLADHDGGWQRRDTAGVVVGLLGLMTSAFSVPMVLGVGVFVLLRRGWRIAATHTVPLGAVFFGWWVMFGGGEQSDVDMGTVAEFVFHMWRATFAGLAGSDLGGAVLATVAVIGVVALARAAGRDGNRVALAIPAALLTAQLASTIVTAVNRSGFDDDVKAAASQGRYLHVGAALMVPLVGVGAQRLWQTRPPLVLVPLVALALGLPDNIDAIRHRSPFSTGNEDLVLAIAHSPLLPDIRGDHRPVPFSVVEAAWLAEGARNGDIPEPDDDVGPQVFLQADGLAALQLQASGDFTCTPRQADVEQTVSKGTKLVFGAPSTLLVVGDGIEATRGTFAEGDTIKVLAGPIDIAVRGVDGESPAVCLE